MTSSVAMVRYRYKRCQANHTVFVKRKNVTVVMLVAYVDDIVVTGNDDEEIKNIWGVSLKLRTLER